MDISDYTKATGMFLKAENITAENFKAVVTGEAELKPNEKFGGERLHVPVCLGDSEYVFDASKTNSRVLSDALGADTKTWIGKIIVLEKYKTKTSDGKMVDAINVKEVLKEATSDKTLP